VDRCRLGDRKAQYELYKLYSKAMFNVSMRIANDYADAEDILQESFLSAFQNIHAFKGDSTFGAWLKRIVVNNSISLIQKKRLNLSPLEGHDVADVSEGPDEEELSFQVENVRRAIQQLPDGYRVVLSLYLLEGYDHQEISEILRITESTSKSQYSRARKKLLEMLRGGRLGS
jgi:RNA polymerase sigma factor (sigma-70 family)